MTALIMLKYLTIGIIFLYQKTLSPDHGLFRIFFPYGYCKFQPTCSNYMKEAVRKYGFFRGFFLGTKRIFRCNPWSQGGSDPVK